MVRQDERTHDDRCLNPHCVKRSSVPQLFVVQVVWLAFWSWTGPRWEQVWSHSVPQPLVWTESIKHSLPLWSPSCLLWLFRVRVRAAGNLATRLTSVVQPVCCWYLGYQMTFWCIVWTLQHQPRDIFQDNFWSISSQLDGTKWDHQKVSMQPSLLPG